VISLQNPSANVSRVQVKKDAELLAAATQRMESLEAVAEAASAERRAAEVLLLIFLSFAGFVC
jgi:hypothetical protein